MNKNMLDTDNTSSIADEKLPFFTCLPLSLQHVLAMYAGCIIVPYSIAQGIHLDPQTTTFLVSCSLFASGIGSFIQSFGLGSKIGIKLPLVLGSAFVSLAPIISIANGMGGGIDSLLYIMPAVIISGLLLFLIAPVYSKISFLFSPIVIGSYLLALGISLVPIATSYILGAHNDVTAADPSWLILALFTILVIVLLNRLTKGFVKGLATLAGIVLGTILGIFMHQVDFTTFNHAAWFQIIRPFKYGAPHFDGTLVKATFTIFIVVIMSSVDAMGAFFTLGNVCEKPFKDKEVSKAIRGEGLAIAFSGLFNSIPLTSFVQNVGLVIMSGIRSRYITIYGSVVLIVLGLIPKFSALATLVPSPVLGAATLSMFTMVAVAGIDMLADEVNLKNLDNMLIIAISVGIGLLLDGKTVALSNLPSFLGFFLSQGIIMTALIAMILNLVFNGIKKPKDTIEK